MTSSRKGTHPKSRAGNALTSKVRSALAPSKAAVGKKRAGVISRKALEGKAEGTKPPRSSSGAGAVKKQRSSKSGQWVLQDAKARFSELVRRVKADGPQRVSVHGRVEVVVISADEFRRLQGERTGAALVQAMQASPHRDIDLAPARSAMPVRNIEL